jgi:organic radical activating enzyme
VNTATATKFQCVEEWSDEFLALFSHRYDYIWADHKKPGAKVEWKTESRHPLSDRLIRQGTYLYGVRFGAETQYCLLDIDVNSPYHPKQDPFAISRIVAALEPIGLVRHIACTSSYSGGLHLYFPFTKTQSSWQLAIAIATLLESAGFKLTSGQLEIFPNPKPYITDGTPSLFNAHRLPMQAGSYLLNDDFQPIWSTQSCFVRQWTLAQKRNDLDIQTLKRILKQTRRKHFCVSGKADKFINDLNAEIESGWTGYGQTNRLLGRITMREYIFHHVLSGGEPLQGQALVDEIVSTARALPGYQEWCQHQHEIEKRAEEWARCIENSHYFHYGDLNGKFKSKSDTPKLTEAIENAPTWNQQQSESARDRIRSAIAELLEKNALPAKATARFQALLQHGVGGGSLYRHRDLWHPSYLVENPPDPPILNITTVLAIRLLYLLKNQAVMSKWDRILKFLLLI